MYKSVYTLYFVCVCERVRGGGRGRRKFQVECSPSRGSNAVPCSVLRVLSEIGDDAREVRSRFWRLCVEEPKRGLTCWRDPGRF